MDEFYARLAHYVRHAETGGNVVVTRWGKPVATLGPFAESVPQSLAPADESQAAQSASPARTPSVTR